MAIERLPENLINQIAAGEVVERPASVVKELVENAIDAHAKNVVVHVVRGGTERIIVQDDGVGMSPDDALMALERHATSKIRSVDDLFSISSLGFRGEALPSIASVSRFELETAISGAAAGCRIRSTDGTASAPEPGPPIPGTKISVHDLFWSVPARRKFLKTDRTEQARCIEVVRQLALARPDISFVVRAEDRVVLDLPSTSSLRERVSAVVGASVADNLHPFTHGAPPMEVFGFASDVNTHRAGVGSTHLYVNGRAVRDRTMLAAIRDGYSGLVPRGRHPIVVAFIEIEPSTVDVNVHPAKTEVRFRDSAAIYRLLRGASENRYRGVGPSPIAIQEQSLPWFASVDESGPRRSEVVHPQPRRDVNNSTAKARDQQANSPTWLPSGVRPSDAPTNFVVRDQTKPTEEPDVFFGAVGERVIVWGDGTHLVIVHAHAAQAVQIRHALSEVGSDDAARCRLLLVPAVVALTPKHHRAVLAHLDVLGSIGFEIDDFGEGEIAVKGVPRPLPPVDIETLIVDLAQDLADSGGGKVAASGEVVGLLSCKCAQMSASDLCAASNAATLVAVAQRQMNASCVCGPRATIRLTEQELLQHLRRGSASL